MLKKPMIFISLIYSLSAMANYGLSQNTKKVVCYGEDSIYITLDSKRTTMKFEVEGETDGPKKITKTLSDNITYTSYKSEYGILTLSNKKNTFQFWDDEKEDAGLVDCK
jgi:hypothetical protein